MILAVCGLSFALGLVTGRLTAPLNQVEPHGIAAKRLAAALELDPATTEPNEVSIDDEKGLKQQFLEGLKDDPRVVLAQKLAAGVRIQRLW